MSASDFGEISRRQWLQSAAAAGLASALPAAADAGPGAVPAATSIGELERAFRDPPAEAKPGVFWYWMNGVVTREGITADLTAMASAGFGRAILFSIGLGPGAPGMKQYPSLTPEWWDMFAFAIHEAGRVGIEITVGVCDGWATAAGPWITPELSMQRLTWSQTWVAGGDRLAGSLPQPVTAMDYYRDIATIAFPLPHGWSNSVERGATVGTSWKTAGAASLNAYHAGPVLDTDQAGWIDYRFDAPFTLRGVLADGPLGPAGSGLKLEVSDGGDTFRAIGTLAQADETTLAASAGLAPNEHLAEPIYVVGDGKPVTARIFRFRFEPATGPAAPGEFRFSGPTGDPVPTAAQARLRLSRLLLLDEPVIPDLNARAGRVWSLPPADLTDADLPGAGCVPAASIVDLSSRVHVDGTLDWTPPDRRPWKIVRIGHTSTGAVNGTGFPAGRGLECDKLNAAATRIQFDHWLGELARRVDKNGAGRALSMMHTDSWECGSQNWSPVFPAEFAKRRGYDLLALAPVMAGVPIDGADTVNRVLTDIRRTIGETTADNFFGEMARLGREAGFRYSAEPANPIYPTDALIYAKHADHPMGEFWVFGDDKPSDIADAVHGGHVYGRRVIGAEAFTEFAMQWSETPYSCKPLGDANWAKGVNQLTCHVWAAQPWTDAAHEPGMTLANIGVFFSRTNTWFELAKPWFDYMRRGQALLQQGRAVADIACYLGEDVPRRAYVPSNTPLPIPDGYAFDSINTDALLTRATVRDGWIVLPEGQRYAVLLLPRRWRVSPRVMARIAALVHAGATVIGEPPLGSIGLEGGKEGAEAVAATVRALWPAGEPGLRSHGAGTIGMVDRLDALLGSRGVGPDCPVQTPGEAPSPIMWTHRSGEGWDLYFLSNQTARARSVTVRCREGKGIAELWDADTGEVRPLEAMPGAGRGELTLRLDPCGSAFVVFRAGAHKRLVRPAAPPPAAPAIPLAGGWTVTFARGLPAPQVMHLDALVSWTQFPSDELRHYSGTAVYETIFDRPAGGMHWQLDLGEVAELCEVELNGRMVRRLWKPPFLVDLDPAVMKATSRLVVRVANTWRNRLVGDGKKPPEQRRSFTVTPFFDGKPSPFPQDPGDLPKTDPRGFFLGGGFGNDASGVPSRGTPAGTPPPSEPGISRFGFTGGGSTAPGPDVRRRPDPNGLITAGLIGPVMLRPRLG